MNWAHGLNREVFHFSLCEQPKRFPLGVCVGVGVFYALSPLVIFGQCVWCRSMYGSGRLGSAGVREVLLLESVPLLRKYSGFIDAGYTSLFCR